MAMDFASIMQVVELYPSWFLQQILIFHSTQDHLMDEEGRISDLNLSEKVIFHYITLYGIIRAIRKFDDISDVTTP